MIEHYRFRLPKRQHRILGLDKWYIFTPPPSQLEAAPSSPICNLAATRSFLTCHPTDRLLLSRSSRRMSANTLRGCSSYPRDVQFMEIDQSSNETESNLPGSGRLLGNVYQHFGRKLEVFANNIAARYNIGPNAVAVRIRKRVSLAGKEKAGRYDTNIHKFWYDGKKEAAQRKDLKKLIRYTKSPIESTCKQALENLIDVILEHDHLLALIDTVKAIKSIKKHEPYIWDYFGSSIRITSCLAITCLQERKLLQLARQIKDNSYGLDGDYHDAKKILDFMRGNTEESYLAIRLFSRCMVFVDRNALIEWFLLETLENFKLKECPDTTEWDEIDRIFAHWLESAFEKRSGFSVDIGLFWHMLLLKRFLPRTFQSKSFNKLRAALEHPEETFGSYGKLICSHFFLASLLYHRPSRSERGVEWLSQNCMPFLNNVDVVLSKIAYQYGEHDDRFPSNIKNVVIGCEELAMLIDSDDADIKSRAVRSINFVLRHDRYSCELMLDALSQTDFRRTSGYDIMVKAIRPAVLDRRNIPQPYTFKETIYRHCDSKGHLIHLVPGDHWSYDDNTWECSRKGCMTEYVLSIDNDNILCTGRPSGISSLRMLVPILAGRLPDDQRAFVAIRRGFPAACYYWTKNSLSEIPIDVEVPLIRYPDDTCGLPHISVKGVTVDESTSEHYTWVFRRNIPFIQEISAASAEDYITPLSLVENEFNLGRDGRPGTASDSDEISITDFASFVTAEEDINIL